MANETQTPRRGKQNYDKSGKLQARRDQRYFEAVARARSNLVAAEKLARNSAAEKEVPSSKLGAYINEFPAVVRANKALRGTTRKEDRKK